MNSIINLLSNFKSYHDITAEEYQKVLLHYQSFFKNHQYPRFFQSYLYLRAERKYFYYGFIDDCFVLVKKYKQFGNRIVYLCLPPISLSGDLDKELKLINLFADLGVKTRLSEEDMQVYNLKKKDLQKNKDDIEHIYRAGDFTDLSLPTFFKFRYNLAKFEKYKAQDLLKYSVSQTLSKDQIKNIDHLVDNWSKFKTTKSKSSFQADQCHQFFNNNQENIYFEASQPDNKIITSSINEKVDKNKVIITTNYSDYNYQIKDLQANKALHCLMMQYWGEKDPEILCNSGSGGYDKGLTAHKRQLRPIKELQLYNTNIKIKISEEDYQLICKG